MQILSFGTGGGKKIRINRRFGEGGGGYRENGVSQKNSLTQQ